MAQENPTTSFRLTPAARPLVNARAGDDGAHRPLENGVRVRVQVPASTANLGPGFDSIGMALGVWDEAQLDVGGDELVVQPRGQGSDDVPRDASHLVVRSMLEGWRGLGLDAPQGLRLQYDGAIPHSRGMGSSAAAIVAGVALAVAAAGHDLADAAVLAYVNDSASRLEGHPDNASASVYGGATVSWADDAGGWHSALVRPHEDVVPVVIVPTTRLATATARAALPASVTLADAARNSGRSALLVHALTHAPHLLLAATRDYLHQEARRPAYPDAMALVDELRAQGVAACISGAGPTVVALTTPADASVVEFLTAEQGALALTVPSHGVRAVSPR